MKRVSWFALLAACSSTPLIPDYEVLSVPVSSERYRVGVRWNTSLGAPDSAEPVVEAVGRAEGLQELSTDLTVERMRLQLTAAVVEWIAGALGISDASVLRVRLEGLTHHFVEDTSQATSRAILLETVTAESIELSIRRDTGARVEIDADALERDLAEDAGVSLDVEARSEHAYSIRAERPLVVAVRVAELQRLEPLEETRPLDLSAAARNTPQEVGLGYRVTVQEVDPVRGTARVVIANPSFPQWKPVEHVFGPGLDATWVNPRREAIAESHDARVGEAQYVWDSLTLVWPPDGASLSQAGIYAVRQYMRAVPVASGLSTR